MENQLQDKDEINKLQNLNEMLQLSYQTIKNKLEAKIAELEEENDTYYNWWQNASKELKQLRNEQPESISYNLNKNEMASFIEWRDNVPCKNSATHILKLNFMGNAIGRSVTISCTVCGKSKDITDFDN